jgi:hypothetical protein
MLVTGEWQLRDDGVMRPIVRAKVLGGAGNLVPENFLIDSGADRTVFSATLLAQLQLPTKSAQPGVTLSGDPTATDLSVLGRDVLDNFDLVISRRRNEILLLAPRHQYRIEQS